MKTKTELFTMLHERLAELQQGGLIVSYEDQLRAEIALLAVILEDDIDAECWATIEAGM